MVIDLINGVSSLISDQMCANVASIRSVSRRQLMSHVLEAMPLADSHNDSSQLLVKKMAVLRLRVYRPQVSVLLQLLVNAHAVTSNTTPCYACIDECT